VGAEHERGKGGSRGLLSVAGGRASTPALIDNNNSTSAAASACTSSVVAGPCIISSASHASSLASVHAFDSRIAAISDSYSGSTARVARTVIWW
jgi:hypothetical protein